MAVGAVNGRRSGPPPSGAAAAATWRGARGAVVVTMAYLMATPRDVFAKAREFERIDELKRGA